MLQRRNVLHLLACLVLGGCSSAAQVGAVREDAASSFAGPEPERGAGGAYILGPGDRLRIKVYNEADLTGEYEVNSTGFISLPLVGQVRASGSTTSQLERTIVAKMKGQISQDPKVNVELAAYAPFYIFGEVKKAGEYPYRPGLTVADAVATAGGLTYRANENKIYLRRAGALVEETVSLEMRVRVYPGDNIRVDERYF